jgi:predicted RND superfamily exporter protein
MTANHELSDRSSSRRLWSRFASTPFVMATAGCSGSPMFNILGSYFPSWLVCVAISIGLTLLAHLLVTTKKVADQLWPLPIVYSALLCFFGCTLWLIFFV